MKSVSPTSVAKAGDPVTFSYALTNTGAATLSNPSITETAFSGTGTLGAPTCPASIAPGATVACTVEYVFTQADIDAGRVMNTSVAHADSPSGVVTSDESSAQVTARQTSDITIDVSGSIRGGHAGDTVTFKYVVTNTGNTTLTTVGVTTTAFSGSGPQPVPVCPLTMLLPGESMVCTAPYVLTDEDAAKGIVTTEATAHGEPPSGGGVASEPGSADVQLPPIVVVPQPPTTPPSSTPPASPAPPAPAADGAAPLAGTGSDAGPVTAIAAFAALMVITGIALLRRRVKRRVQAAGFPGTASSRSITSSSACRYCGADW
ncbi:DUF7507 domain-containing protein [Leifsonia xyli]|uniref:DUF7507 domain-containing protein n=1 Tax=Leifsonia xyli TaxID=1575 RepID=UPI003D666BAF